MEIKKFSERGGYVDAKHVQFESMDRDLRNSIFNGLIAYTGYLVDEHAVRKEVLVGGILGEQKTVIPTSESDRVKTKVLANVWVNFLKNPVDEFGLDSAFRVVKKFCLNEDWFLVYDLVEFLIERSDISFGKKERDELVKIYNRVMKKENSAYTIINGLITPISNKVEIESIERACNAPFANVGKHISNSLILLSDRKSPHFKNSVKEAISAVECLAREVGRNPNGTLSSLVEGLPLRHKAFTNALKNLYGFTSDKGGIRHSEKPNENLTIDQNTARFMLVTCSAFVNYIISLHQESENDESTKR